MDRWLSDAEWAKIQGQIPVVCVDVLAFQRDARGNTSIGLIHRQTPHQGPRWCLIGGRLLLNESFSEAVQRQIDETLGPDVVIEQVDIDRPVIVAEYFSRQRPGLLFDPRKHAVCMTFVAQIGGSPVARGEADAFRWFEISQIPDESEIGFGQGKIVRTCIQQILGIGAESLSEMAFDIR